MVRWNVEPHPPWRRRVCGVSGDGPQCKSRRIHSQRETDRKEPYDRQAATATHLIMGLTDVIYILQR